MKRVRVLGWSAALALAVWAALPPAPPLGPPAAFAQTDSLDEVEKRRQMEDLTRRARESREAAKRLKGQESKAVTQLKRSERELNATRRRLRDLARRRQNFGMQLEVTRVDLQRNVQSLGDHRNRLKRRLREIYKFGPARELEFMLSTSSFAQLLARWDFLLMVAEQDRQLLEQVRDRKELVETLERRLEGHLTQVERTTLKTTSETRRLASQRQTRESAVREIRTQRQAFEAMAVELEKTAKEIQRVLAQLERRRREEAERARAEGRPAVPYTGEFARGQGSLDWPARGEVVGRFGNERHPRHNVVVPNNGIDIAVGIGTAVKSVAKGKVDYVADDYGTYGQMIIVNHGSSYYTLYAHLSSIAVSVGQEVSVGQVIGSSGDSGSLKGPVLHFEVRRGATALDPMDWLQ